MKKQLPEILIILVVAIALGIGYNYFGGKKLPIIYEKPNYGTTSDSELFDGDNHKPQLGNPMISPKENESTIAAPVIKNDSSAGTVSSTKKNDTLKFVSKKAEAIADATSPASKIEKTNSKSEIDPATGLSKVKIVTYNQILKIIDDPKFLLIDARHKEAWDINRIGHSINIYPYDDEDQVFHKIIKLPYDKKLVVYCDGGTCDSSHKLADMMVSAGYTNVFIYQGGWDEWTKKKGIK